MGIIKWLKTVYKNMNKRLLIAGITLAVIARLIGLSPQPSAVSALEMYDYGMTLMFSGIIGLLGDTILLIAIVMAIIRTVKSPPKCNIFGAIIQSADDKFCRSCGSAIV
jgi:hypothetical protein